jgi:hypothetical protein
VIGILADANIQGYVDFLVALMQAEPWKLFWDDLQLTYVRFSDVGLAHNAPDSLIWDICQQRSLVLITDNRSENDPDSLETTIRTKSMAKSLPVLTIGDIQQLRHSREYVNRVIDTFLESMYRIDSLRGTGRLFLP